MITPMVGHVTCDLDQQRRLHEARRRGLVRSVRGARPRKGRRGYPDPHAHRAGEDVWHALRF